MNSHEMRNQPRDMPLEKVKDMIVQTLFPQLISRIPGSAVSYHKPEGLRRHWLVEVEVPNDLDISPDLPKDIQGIEIKYFTSISPL